MGQADRLLKALGGAEWARRARAPSRADGDLKDDAVSVAALEPPGGGIEGVRVDGKPLKLFKAAGEEREWPGRAQGQDRVRLLGVVLVFAVVRLLRRGRQKAPSRDEKRAILMHGEPARLLHLSDERGASPVRFETDHAAGFLLGDEEPP
jgi:hypothetical protein